MRFICKVLLWDEYPFALELSVFSPLLKWLLRVPSCWVNHHSKRLLLSFPLSQNASPVFYFPSIHLSLCKIQSFKIKAQKGLLRKLWMKQTLKRACLDEYIHMSHSSERFHSHVVVLLASYLIRCAFYRAHLTAPDSVQFFESLQRPGNTFAKAMAKALVQPWIWWWRRLSVLSYLYFNCISVSFLSFFIVACHWCLHHLEQQSNLTMTTSWWSLIFCKAIPEYSLRLHFWIW